MNKSNAKTKMQALVVARLLMGDFDNWEAFVRERTFSLEISNRQKARSAASQIGKTYKKLSRETQAFISENFENCGYDDLAKLCEKIPVNKGISMRLNDFEDTFFPLASRIKREFPLYAHVSISIYGLQFEFPEHHFLRDLRSALKYLEMAKSHIAPFRQGHLNPKTQRDEIAEHISQRNFLSRSIISAAFSLVESFVSGLFFTAIDTNSIGTLQCGEEFLSFAQKKESAALKDRLDQLVRFASEGRLTGEAEPFRSFIDIGKPYRDAIHHTTPFGRKNIEPGMRLTTLYAIDDEIALQCALFSLDSVLDISRLVFENPDTTAIGMECGRLKQKTLDLQSGELE